MRSVAKPFSSLNFSRTPRVKVPGAFVSTALITSRHPQAADEPLGLQLGPSAGPLRPKNRQLLRAATASLTPLALPVLHSALSPYDSHL